MGDRAVWTRLGQAAPSAPCLDVLNLGRCTSPALVPPTSLRRSCPPMASARVFSSPLTRLQPLVRPLALSLSSSPRGLHFVKTRQVPTDEQLAYDGHTTSNQPASPLGVFSVLCGASGKCTVTSSCMQDPRHTAAHHLSLDRLSSAARRSPAFTLFADAPITSAICVRGAARHRRREGTQRRLARQAAQGVGEPPTTWWSCSLLSVCAIPVTYMQPPIGFVGTQARAAAQAGFRICCSVVGVSLAVAARPDGPVSWSTSNVTIRPFVSVCCPMITAMLSLRLVHIAALTSTDPVDTATLSHAQHASSHVCSPRASAPASRTPHLHLTFDCAVAGPGCEVR
jgi:hypothetical protein